MPLHPGAGKKRDRARTAQCCKDRSARLLLAAAVSLLIPFAVFSQDSGSIEKELFGNGVQVSVTVHDDSGAPISTPATVSLLCGTIPCGRAETSNGNAMLVVNRIGELTVVVNAPGFREGREYFSVHAEGRAQVDVYLKRLNDGEHASGTPGRPILAPKAKEALDKGLLALNSDKMGEAEKQLAQASRLAPAHPDVLYAQGILKIRQQDFAGAQSTLEKAIQVDPAHSRAFAALGMVLYDQGKFDLAVVPLEKSMQLSPGGSWGTRWALAKAYYQLGRYPDALKMSQEALAGSNGKEPGISLLVAQSLTAVGSYEEAAQLLRDFVRDFPDRREAATARRWLNSLSADGKIHSANN